MNKALSFILIINILIPETTHYWNLGIAIKNQKVTTKIVQKEIDLNTFFVEQKSSYKKNTQTSEPMYTLNTDYMIEPRSIDIHKKEEAVGNNRASIKELILNEEYFEAAKQIVYIDDGQALIEFESLEELYYWSAFVYYNLGNQSAAYENIEKLSNRSDCPKTLFLEALILKETSIKEAKRILNQIITQFPNNDYSAYAKNLLLDN